MKAQWWDEDEEVFTRTSPDSDVWESSECTYEGTDEDGFAQGEGKMTKKSGERYEGHFERGMFNGDGTLYDVKGKIMSGSEGPLQAPEHGQWMDGKFTPKVGIVLACFCLCAHMCHCMARRQVVRLTHPVDPARLRGLV